MNHIDWSSSPTEQFTNHNAALAFVCDGHACTDKRRHLESTLIKGAARSRKMSLNITNCDGPQSTVLNLGLMPTLEVRQFYNALSLEEGKTGAFARPAGFLPALEQAMYTHSPVRKLATVWRQGGNPVRRPAIDASSVEGTIVGESTTDTTPNFAQIEIAKRVFLGKWILPRELDEDLLEETALGLAQALGTIVSARQNRLWTNGNSGLIAAAYPVTAAAAASVTADDIEALIAGVGAEYLNAKRCTFMMHPSTWLTLRKLKDGAGHYVYERNLFADFPIVLNTNMPSTIAASQPIVLFGDFSRFNIVDTAQTRVDRLDEVLVERGQVLWMAQQESGGALLDAGTHPVCKLVMAAS